MDCNEARETLIRAVLGEDLVSDERQQAESHIDTCPLCQARFAELAEMVTMETEITCDGCREQLHDYVEAQLAGYEGAAEFSEIRRHLDTCVDCSEAYALLYETLWAEQQGLIPQPRMVPTLNTGFLSSVEYSQVIKLDSEKSGGTRQPPAEPSSGPHFTVIQYMSSVIKSINEALSKVKKPVVYNSFLRATIATAALVMVSFAFDFLFKMAQTTFMFAGDPTDLARALEQARASYNQLRAIRIGLIGLFIVLLVLTVWTRGEE